MKNKVMALFGLETGRNEPGNQDSERPPCYVVSPRDRQRLRPDVSVHLRPVGSFDSIERRPWASMMNLNIDEDLFCLRSDIMLLRRLLFLDFTRITELVLINERTSDQLVSKARGCHVPVQQVSYESRPGRIEWVDALGFRSSEQLAAVLWPDNVYELLNSVSIGLTGPDSYVGSIRLEQHTDPVCCAITKPDQILPPAIARDATWVYTVRMSYMSYDAPDPEYWIADPHFETLREWLKDSGKGAGYEVREIPLLEPLVWNWILYGEVPVLDAPDASASGVE